MKHTIKLITALSAIMLGVLLAGVIMMVLSFAGVSIF